MQTTEITLDEAVANWLKAVTEKVLNPQVNDEWVERNGKPYTSLETDDGSKFIRIVSANRQGSSRSSWAFVAKDDGESKALGQWKKGDIFKSASWRAPAKHARGNVFDLSNGPTCNVTQWTGPNYLK
jgi:hypothetical protein